MADSREKLERKFSHDLPLPLAYTDSNQVKDCIPVQNIEELHATLKLACFEGDVEQIKEILEKNNIGVNFKFNDGYSLLTSAIMHNQTRLFNFLLREPRIDIKLFCQGGSALCMALRGTNRFKTPNYEMARALIEAGADINHANSGGPLLMDAWYDGNQELANQLVRLGANIDAAERSFNNTCMAEKPNFTFFTLNKKNIIRQGIGFSRQQECLNNAKWLGIGVVNFSFHFDAEGVNSKISEFLIDGTPLSKRGFNLGCAMMHNRLSAQFPTPAPTPAPIPRSLFFMRDLENCMSTSMINELIWQSHEQKYNHDFPNHAEHGYGPGAMVVYKP